MAYTLLADGQPCVLRLDDAAVERCTTGYALGLRLRGGLLVRVEEPFELVTADGVEHRIDPDGGAAACAPALALAHRAVSRGSAFGDGRLELAFDDGSVLRVAVSASYEAWTITGDDGLRVVSLPGGGLAVWGPRGEDAAG